MKKGDKMSGAKEVTITCKNEDKKLVLDHLIYEEFVSSFDDQILSALIDAAVKEFGDPECDVKLKIMMVR